MFQKLTTAGSGAVPVIARVVIGLLFFFHGLDKLNAGVAGFADALASQGVPLATTAAWATAILELVGGLMLVVGLLARLLAVLFTLLLLAAIALVKVEVGLIGASGAGAELDLAYIVGLVVVLLLGPGRPSLDHVLRLERSTPVGSQRVPV